MCGLCGVLGGAGHWTEGAVGGSLETRRATRLRRVRLMNAVLRHYRLTLADWQGTSYLLSGPTGGSELVGDLVQVWRSAERVAGQSCDPLDERLIERLEREA